jgi:hypothetical protein
LLPLPNLVIKIRFTEIAALATGLRNAVTQEPFVGMFEP